MFVGVCWSLGNYTYGDDGDDGDDAAAADDDDVADDADPALHLLACWPAVGRQPLKSGQQAL